MYKERYIMTLLHLASGNIVNIEFEVILHFDNSPVAFTSSSGASQIPGTCILDCLKELYFPSWSYFPSALCASGKYNPSGKYKSGGPKNVILHTPSVNICIILQNIWEECICKQDFWNGLLQCIYAHLTYIYIYSGR